MARRKRIWAVIASVFFAFLLILLILLNEKVHRRKELKITFDADYFWAKTLFDDSKWFYETVPAGFEYYLYIPSEYRNDRHNESAKLPLIVTFHGSNDKYASRQKFGRMFLDDKIQSIKKCAVLVLHSRGDYFTNCYDVSLFLQNFVARNECIDRKCIIGFGHSQGAEFVVKLACYEPALFKAVISGSGYYRPMAWEVMNVLPIRFYWKIAKYDKGIYEQGYKTGRTLARFCKSSVNVELDSREHCWVELDDKGADTTFLAWFKSAIDSE